MNTPETREFDTSDRQTSGSSTAFENKVQAKQVDTHGARRIIVSQISVSLYVIHGSVCSLADFPIC